jgi:hypothetical protein
VKWLADENFDNDIVRGVLRRSPELDMVRAQDLPQVAGEDDAALLAWATQDGRVVLTHDLSTMIPAMREQLRRASVCAPMVLVPESLPIGSVIEQVLLLDECAVEADWAAGVVFLPL